MDRIPSVYLNADHLLKRLSKMNSPEEIDSRCFIGKYMLLQIYEQTIVDSWTQKKEVNWEKKKTIFYGEVGRDSHWDLCEEAKEKYPDFYVDENGGGYFEYNPLKKEIILSGGSDNILEMKDMKFLFINDDAEYLSIMADVLADHDNVIFAECHNVDEGLQAVKANRPNTIFLDHCLTDNGNEGFEIACRVDKKIKIYSTTITRNKLRKYRQCGIEIEHVDSMDLNRIRKILTGKEI